MSRSAVVRSMISNFSSRACSPTFPRGDVKPPAAQAKCSVGNPVAYNRVRRQVFELHQHVAAQAGRIASGSDRAVLPGRDEKRPPRMVSHLARFGVSGIGSRAIAAFMRRIRKSHRPRCFAPSVRIAYSIARASDRSPSDPFHGRRRDKVADVRMTKRSPGSVEANKSGTTRLSEHVMKRASGD